MYDIHRTLDLGEIRKMTNAVNHRISVIGTCTVYAAWCQGVTGEETINGIYQLLTQASEGSGSPVIKCFYGNNHRGGSPASEEVQISIA